MPKEYIFSVLRISEYGFGFFCKGEEETYELYDELKVKFPSKKKFYPIKLVTGLMANINTKDYNGMKFWSDKISNYVHETPDSPKTFKFVLDISGNFVISPLAQKEK